MRSERGEISLTGLLVAMVLFGIVMAATLLVFQTSETVTRDTMKRTDAQDRARVAEEILAKNLRNLAGPPGSLTATGVEQAQTLATKGDYDLAFSTVDPAAPTGGSANLSNVKRVRYCLSDDGKLYKQQQTWTGAAPNAPAPTTECPTVALGNANSAQWQTKTVIADNVVNKLDPSLNLPVFTYDSTDPTRVSQIHVNLMVDIDVAHKPRATTIATGILLRNQNRVPVAKMTWVVSPAQGIVLNGSASVDPEGQPLKYCWVDTGQTAVNVDPETSAQAKCPAGTVGMGVTFAYLPTARGMFNITLAVKDPVDQWGIDGPHQISW
jgi:type II secretory pathway pseudopilin PulG